MSGNVRPLSSRWSTGWLLTGVLVAAAAVAGCKQDDGDPCETNRDCSSGYCLIVGAEKYGTCEPPGTTVTPDAGTGADGGPDGASDAPAGEAAPEVSGDTGANATADASGDVASGDLASDVASDLLSPADTSDLPAGAGDAALETAADAVSSQ
jgi:hypothetical protein